MRKFMTKEITKTTVKLAVMAMSEAGLPTATQLDDMVFIGNVPLEKAQKEVNKIAKEKKLGNVTVFGVEASTEVYKLPVEEFLKYATLATAEDVAEAEAAPESETQPA